jgi:NADPH2:quinone reductase
MSKAFRFDRHGGPEVLHWADVEAGAPGPGEVRMRNTAVAVNYRDVLMRRGVHAVRSLPSGIGLESAGVIDAVGPEVGGFSVGDRVAYAGMPEGSYAELRIVPAARLIALPAGIDERTAASMMIRGMTARSLLKETYRVQPGDTILVHAHSPSKTGVKRPDGPPYRFRPRRNDAIKSRGARRRGPPPARP